jgi:DNA-binding transcriptional regulator LsrR (DeoR family)
MYYVQGLTQEEIGIRLKYSRTKITRLLAKARKVGIVEININSSFRSCLDVEESMRNLFDLEDIIIVPTGATAQETRDGVGKACAAFLEQKLSDGETVGCAWGRALFSIGKSLRDLSFHDISVVQLVGGMNVGQQINPQEILRLIVSKLNARAVWLNTPAIVDTPEIKEALLSDEGVKQVLVQGKSCDIALVGIGDVTDDASLIAAGALTAKEMRELRKLGAVGDIMSRFFNSEGVPIQHSITDRVISVTLDGLKQVPLRIGCTAGMEKSKTILGALRGGYINVLVTDEQSAQESVRLYNCTRGRKDTRLDLRDDELEEKVWQQE